MPTVLVVDDSAVDRRLVKGILEQDSALKVECTENGSEALQRMHESIPELILTDMQMPDMNGLELVMTTRLQYPNIPIVLMTAHGSESLAVEALEQGAASYVPKSRLAEKLLGTVDEVLTCARAERKNAQLIGCMTRANLAYQLDNDVTLIGPLVETVQEVVSGMELCSFNEQVRLGVALKEALLNAMFCGNLQWDNERMPNVREKLHEGEERELYDKRRSDPRFVDRRVHVDVIINKAEVALTIRDDGPGFDTSIVPQAHDPNALEPQRGRGLWLIRSFMDEVLFNEAGNEIKMIKRRIFPGNQSK